MAKFNFSVIMKNTWILSHRDDSELPAVRLKKHLESKYGRDAQIVTAGFTTVKVEYEGDRDEQTLSLDVIEFFEDFYDETKNSGVYSISFEDLPFMEENPPADTKCEVVEEDKIAAELSDSLDFIREVLGEDSDDGLFDDDKADKGKKEEKCNALKRCEEIIGCKQFKDLANEIASIAPVLKKQRMLPVFMNQAYLFAINNGSGTSTVVKLFSELIYDLGLVTSSAINEFVLPAKKGENDDAFSEVLSCVRTPFRSRNGTVCIDISEWMNEVKSKPFQKFLQTLSGYQDKYTIIFKIPFVDKEVVADISDALNDVMTVRAISFTPYTVAELRSFAKTIIIDQGFDITDRAWVHFDERIALEKSDGRFYGMRTVQKIVNELFYHKQLDNAVKGRTDMVINARDTRKLLGGVDSNELTASQMLDRMIGCENVKNRIAEIIAQIEIARLNDNGEIPCIHMRFVGNPGTGKTTVARIIGKLLKEKGILRVGNFFEYPGRYFCGRFIGETAPKTASLCRDAYGSVLFIDEAYSLYRQGGSGADYGKEAIDTLIAEMENHRSDLLVIMAGYPEEMQTLMKANAGLESRMPYVIEFPNFTREELLAIYKSMVGKKFRYEEGLFDTVKAYFDGLAEETITSKEFSNARFVRNLFERTWAKASMRTQLEGGKTVCLKTCDFELAIRDKEFDFNTKKKKRMGFI